MDSISTLLTLGWKTNNKHENRATLSITTMTGGSLITSVIRQPGSWKCQSTQTKGRCSSLQAAQTFISCISYVNIYDMTWIWIYSVLFIAISMHIDRLFKTVTFQHWQDDFNVWSDDRRPVQMFPTALMQYLLTIIGFSCGLFAPAQTTQTLGCSSLNFTFLFFKSSISLHLTVQRSTWKKQNKMRDRIK